MSNSTEEFIEAFVCSMYGKCQIQMVHYVHFAVFRAKCAPKDENHSFSKIKKPSYLLHQKKSVTNFGSIYVEECLQVCAAIKIGWVLKDGPYWMNLFAGEQMPNHVESAIDDLTDNAESNKNIY